jgi:hypothetical protein
MSGDTKPLHILYLEDDALDAELLQATLADGDIKCQTTKLFRLPVGCAR